jgi:hypothetical protein
MSTVVPDVVGSVTPASEAAGLADGSDTTRLAASVGSSEMVKWRIPADPFLARFFIRFWSEFLHTLPARNRGK